MAKVKKVVINSRIKARTKEQLEELAETQELTISEAVRLILEKYFNSKI